MNNSIIAPSVLNANFLNLKDEITSIEKGGAGLVHLDIMDGHFVPNISFGPGISALIGKATTLPLDCHLMISNPELFVEEFARIGSHYITVQAESTWHLDRILNRIRELGAKPAVSINPATPIENIQWILDLVDMVLVMSVNPGFGGQSLIPYCLDKIRKLREMKLTVESSSTISWMPKKLEQIFLLSAALFLKRILQKRLAKNSSKK